MAAWPRKARRRLSRASDKSLIFFSGPSGLRLDGFQSVFMMCEIKRIVHGFEQGLDVVVMLILLQECLSSRRTWHEHLVWNTTQTGVPLGSLKVNCAPSLRVGKAEWKLAKSRTTKRA